MALINFRNEYCPSRFRRFRRTWDPDTRLRPGDQIIEVPDATISGLEAFESRERIEVFDFEGPLSNPDITISGPGETFAIPAAVLGLDVTVEVKGLECSANNNQTGDFFSVQDPAIDVCWLKLGRFASLFVSNQSVRSTFAGGGGGFIFAVNALSSVLQRIRTDVICTIVAVEPSPVSVYNDGVFFAADPVGPPSDRWAAFTNTVEITTDPASYVNGVGDYSGTFSYDEINVYFDTLFLPV